MALADTTLIWVGVGKDLEGVVVSIGTATGFRIDLTELVVRILFVD